MIIDELQRRHVGKVKCYIDEVNGTATFYLHGILSKKILGYQIYNPKSSHKKTNINGESRYYTYQPSYKETGEYALFGLEYIEGRDTLFLTEGIFEACRLINLGYDALAIIGSDLPPNVITQLYTLNDNIVWCGDNDAAGHKSNLNQFKRMYFDVDLDEVDLYTLQNKLMEFTTCT